MKTFSKWSALILFAFAGTCPLAQEKMTTTSTTSGVVTERSRILQERENVQAAHHKAWQQCQGKFAVTDCERAANRQRRKSLDELRRQELVLNQQERKQEASRQQAKRDERAKKRNEEQRQNKLTLPEPKSTKPVAVNAAQREAQEKSALERFNQKQKEASEHRAKVEASQANRTKPPASSLPVPR